MNLVIHIGRHKSGTSSLQHWLANNRLNLQKKGFLYPTSGLNGRVAHHELAYALDPDSLDMEKARQIAAGITNEYSEAKTIILSSEAFQNASSVAPTIQFISMLGAPIESTTIVCYLREHLDYAMSAYRQLIQNQSAVVPFSEFAKRFPDLSPFFARWRRVGALDVSWFSRSTLTSGNVIEDFCRKIGIEADDYSIENKNVSIGGNLLVFKLASNMIGRGNQSYSKLGELAQMHPRFSRPFFLDNHWCQKIRDSSEFNKSAIKELGPPPSFQNWDNYASLPDHASLKDDIRLICDYMELTNADCIYATSITLDSFFS